MVDKVNNPVRVVPSSPDSTLISRDHSIYESDTQKIKPGFIQLFFANLWQHRGAVVLGLMMGIIGVGTLFLDLVALGIPAIFTAHITCGLFFIGGTLIAKALYDSASEAIMQRRLNESDNDAIYFDPGLLPRNLLPAFEGGGAPTPIPDQDVRQ